MKNNPQAALRAADNALEQLTELQGAMLRARYLPNEENYADVRTLAKDILYLADQAEGFAGDTADRARKAANDALALVQGEAPATAAARRIALKKLGLETLEQRWSDELDFHEHAVWNLRAALETAYAAGLADGKTVC